MIRGARPLARMLKQQARFHTATSSHLARHRCPGGACPLCRPSILRSSHRCGGGCTLCRGVGARAMSVQTPHQGSTSFLEELGLDESASEQERRQAYYQKVLGLPADASEEVIQVAMENKAAEQRAASGQTNEQVVDQYFADLGLDANASTEEKKQAFERQVLGLDKAATAEEIKSAMAAKELEVRDKILKNQVGLADSASEEEKVAAFEQFIAENKHQLDMDSPVRSQSPPGLPDMPWKEDIYSDLNPSLWGRPMATHKGVVAWWEESQGIGMIRRLGDDKEFFVCKANITTDPFDFDETEGDNIATLDEQLQSCGVEKDDTSPRAENLRQMQGKLRGEIGRLEEGHTQMNLDWKGSAQYLYPKMKVWFDEEAADQGVVAVNVHWEQGLLHLDTFGNVIPEGAEAFRAPNPGVAGGAVDVEVEKA